MISLKFKVRLQALNASVADIDTIQEGEQIKDNQYREHMNIDLPTQALRRLGIDRVRAITAWIQFIDATSLFHAAIDDVSLADDDVFLEVELRGACLEIHSSVS